MTAPAALAGKRLGTEPRSTSHYLALWAMSRAGLSLRDVTLVPLSSAFAAGAALKAKKVDAVAGYLGDLDPAMKEVGGNVVASTVDAPHLIATVLVTRGDFAARYPDAIRRLIRGALDANAQAAKDPSDAARALGTAAPALGDPTEAMRSAPPASLKDNLGFFGLEGEAPVTYVESYQSAAALQLKLGATTGAAPAAEETADLGPLRYVLSTKGP
jgi:ABC-type nitrate/sulfonate/bicarbonate transport system substrate-binding protein